jgi:hypothetical protein
MKKREMLTKSFLMLAAVAVVLPFAGCGGSDDDDTPKEVFATDVVVTDASGTVVSSFEVNPKEYFQLNAAVKPDNATNTKYTWSSEDEATATVSASGLVQGVKSGDTKIVVKSNDGKASKSISVKVKDVDYGKAVAGDYEGKIDIKTGGEMFYIDFPVTLVYESVNKVSFEGGADFPPEALTENPTERAMLAMLFPSVPIGMKANLTIGSDGDKGYVISGGGNITLPELLASVMGLPMAGSSFTVVRYEKDPIEKSPIPYINEKGEIYMRFEILGMGEVFYNGKKK